MALHGPVGRDDALLARPAQARALCRRQWFGFDRRDAHRRDLVAEQAKLGRIGIGREHQERRRRAAARGTHRDETVRAVRQQRRVLVQLDACPQDRAAQSGDVLARVQGAAARVVSAEQEGWRDAARPHVGMVQVLCGRAELHPQLHALAQLFLLRGMDAGADHARGAVVAVDAMLGKLAFDVRHALVVEADDPGRLLAAHALEEQFVFQSLAADQVAGVASAGAEAGELALQDDDFRAPGGELQRGRQPGEAGADDHDVGADVALEPGLEVAGLFEPPADGPEWGMRCFGHHAALLSVTARSACSAALWPDRTAPSM